MLDVRTPESIAFSYELAGIGSRSLAVIVDLAIQIVVVLLFFWGLVYAGLHAPHARHALPAQTERFAFNVAIGVLIFIVFAIFYGYFILFEALWKGQTPGKRLLGIRVVRDGGYPIDFMASLVRNILRVGESIVGGYLIALVCALASPENKRVGDLAAGTIVVREARMMKPQAFLDEVAGEPVYAATAYLSGEERALIRRFIDRREALEPGAREALAKRIAERIRDRVPPDLQRLDDEALLERL